LGTAYLDNATDANKVFLDNATDADLIASNTAQSLANAREQNAISNYALYEQNLANRKDGAQISNALVNASNNSRAGLNTVYAGQDATNSSIRNAGMQIGQGRAPEVNVPAYTAPVKESFMGSAAQGLSGGVSTYLMANALFPNGIGGGGSTPDVPSPKPKISGY